MQQFLFVKKKKWPAFILYDDGKSELTPFIQLINELY